MKHFKKMLCCLTSLLLLFLASTGTTTSFAQDADESLQQLSNAPRDASIKTTLSINAPTFFCDNTQYLYAVKYTWQAGSGGDKIAYSKYLNGYYTFLDGENPHTEIIFPSSAYSDKTYCPPSYPYYRTYNSAQDYYSADYKTIDPNDDNFSLETVSDIHCKRTPKEYLSTAKVDYMPTSYDETGFIWYHEGASKQIIVATIAYKDICYNIQVTIPGIGYKKTSVTIYNVTFYLRTGPSRCSIKVSKGDVLRSDVNFAFGVVNKGNDVFSQFNFV